MSDALSSALVAVLSPASEVAPSPGSTAPDGRASGAFSQQLLAVSTESTAGSGKSPANRHKSNLSDKDESRPRPSGPRDIEDDTLALARQAYPLTGLICSPGVHDPTSTAESGYLAAVAPEALDSIPSSARETLNRPPSAAIAPETLNQAAGGDLAQAAQAVGVEPCVTSPTKAIDQSRSSSTAANPPADSTPVHSDNSSFTMQARSPVQTTDANSLSRTTPTVEMLRGQSASVGIAQSYSGQQHRPGPSDSGPEPNPSPSAVVDQPSQVVGTVAPVAHISQQAPHATQPAQAEVAAQSFLPGVSLSGNSQTSEDEPLTDESELPSSETRAKAAVSESGVDTASASPGLSSATVRVTEARRPQHNSSGNNSEDGLERALADSSAHAGSTAEGAHTSRTDAGTGAPASQDTPAANPARAIEQVAQAAQRAAQRGPTSLTVRLDPPELGVLHVKVALTAQGVQAQLRAESPQTNHLLWAHRDDLRDTLQQAGLKLDNLSMPDFGASFGHFDQQRGAFHWQQQPQTRTSEYSGARISPADLSHEQETFFGKTDTNALMDFFA
ncbi:MAG: flagellar hook-length control protein FliK [Armatimonadetes bacterium]|nr:flagellar hook-length control protein FliK [Armatimonadota bacterium]